MSVMRWCFALLFAVATSCSSSRADDAATPEATRAFYYWRTTFALSEAEQRALSEQHVTKLYVRAFDIEWNAGPQLIGKLSGDRIPAGVSVVPVVFIRQDVFRKLPRGAVAIDELAKTTWAAVQQRATALGFTVAELQLDCDWTDTSRDAFFAYVRAVKAASGVTLSSTIRLHQVKYREKTGVPPVERGMLMFYNMGEINAEHGQRAIFDADAARRYLARIREYPLPLDVALPMFSWTVHVRDDVAIDLLQATDPDELPRQDFLRKGGEDRFVATRTAFLHGTLLREGDVLKIERLAPADTLAAAALVAPHLAAGPRTLALFDLSERNLARYDHDRLDQIYRAVR